MGFAWSRSTICDSQVFHIVDSSVWTCWLSFFLRLHSRGSPKYIASLLGTASTLCSNDVTSFTSCLHATLLHRFVFKDVGLLSEGSFFLDFTQAFISNSSSSNHKCKMIIDAFLFWCTRCFIYHRLLLNNDVFYRHFICIKISCLASLFILLFGRSVFSSCSLIPACRIHNCFLTVYLGLRWIYRTRIVTIFWIFGT